MTYDQKMEVLRLRNQGARFSIIAKGLGVSENTVKSFYRRCNQNEFLTKTQSSPQEHLSHCLSCTQKLDVKAKGKPQKFCSESCRRLWWKSNSEKGKRKAYYDIICASCAKRFKSYGNKNRRYCSHKCYIDDRFQGGP